MWDKWWGTSGTKKTKTKRSLLYNMFDPITLALLGLGYLAFKKKSDDQHGVLTPRMEEIYNNAMASLLDPERMRKLAKEFEKLGLKIQADMLTRRARLRARSVEEKKKDQELFERAMKSEKIPGILAVANEFEQMTATGMAGKLRERVKLLQQKTTNGLSPDAKKTVETTAETPQAAE
jgi:hypothetical protein